MTDSIVPRPAQSVEEVAGTMSQSKYFNWTWCGFNFYCEHVRGDRAPQSHTLAFGNAWDRTCDTWDGEKLQRGDGPSPDQTAEMFRGALDDELRSAEDINEGEPKADLVDQGAALARTWVKDLAVNVHPIAMQVPFRIEIPNARFAITGQIDKIGAIPSLSRKFIGDNKTSKTSWSAKRVLESIQRPIYTIGSRHLGLGIEEFQFHIAVRTKTPKIQVLTHQTDQSEIDGAVRRLAIANSQIRHAWESGDWLPNRSHFMCLRRHCRHWRRCEQEFGGTIPV